MLFVVGKSLLGKLKLSRLKMNAATAVQLRWMSHIEDQSLMVSMLIA